MPISASAKKSLRVALRKTAINRRRKRLIKEAIKKNGVEKLAQTISLIDKGAKWGIFHKNKAAHLKSRLMKASAAAPVAKSEKAEKPKRATKAAAKPKAPAEATAKKVASRAPARSATPRKRVAPKKG